MKGGGGGGAQTTTAPGAAGCTWARGLAATYIQAAQTSVRLAVIGRFVSVDTDIQNSPDPPNFHVAGVLPVRGGSAKWAAVLWFRKALDPNCKSPPA